MTYAIQTRDIRWFDQPLEYARTLSDGSLATGDPLPSREPQVRPLSNIGRFEIERSIGRGEMGEVFLARDPQLGRRVALKLLRSRLGSAPGRARVRARREAQALALISHPNVVKVFEVGEHEQRSFLTMEYIEGSTLREWLGAAPRSWREIVAVFIEAGRGLSAAHRAALVHRDFKPDNVLISGTGKQRRVRVVDFGLARIDAAEHDGGLTRPGALLGTPTYMSPEQLCGRPADAASDQFAFCTALYRALWGREPFAGRSVFHRLVQMEADQPTAPRRGQRARLLLWPIIRRGLARDAVERWPSMDELLAALGRVLERRLVRTLITFVTAALGLCVGLGFGNLLESGRDGYMLAAETSATASVVAVGEADD
jgi:serine/threonine protein kinase